MLDRARLKTGSSRVVEVRMDFESEGRATQIDGWLGLRVGDGEGMVGDLGVLERGYY